VLDRLPGRSATGTSFKQCSSVFQKRSNVR
jgi:hypothetical protein